MDVLGIDVSKADFHACLLQGGRRLRHSFANNSSGYEQLERWLKNRQCTGVQACMEATGAYWLGIAQALHRAGASVSVVNPARTAMFARSQLRRTKTDRVDAEMIAEFCQTQRPDLWRPPSPETLEIRALLSYRQQLIAQRTALKQVMSQVRGSVDLAQLHNSQMQHIDEAIQAVEAQLRAKIKEHEALRQHAANLTAVKGIGFLAAASIIARLPIERIRNAKAAAAYAGLTPSERQSGTSVHGKPRICKTGNAELRRDLYMPALAAIRFNPILKAFAERLRDRGKPEKVIIAAAMRKLIVLAYRILSGAIPAPAA